MKAWEKLDLAALFLAALLVAGTFVASRIPNGRRHQEIEEHVLRDSLRCVLELAPIRDTSSSLVIGYNYHMLKRYAESNGQEINIRASGIDFTYLDSLRSGVVDIIAIPFQDSLSIDSVLVSTPVDSVSVWLMRHNDHHHMQNLNEWLAGWDASSEREEALQLFFVKRRPYDDIIRAEASAAGLDWKLVNALIHRESRFHIEALGRRGSAGLMQLMPKTARRLGIDNPLDPEQNIRGGCELLSRLIKRYENVTDDKEEQYRYALSAYNAGVGRVANAINVADSLGYDTKLWLNATVALPETTVEYVNTIMNRYYGNN